MIKHICTVSTNAERRTHGDCFRACIASLLDIPDIETVPHFVSPDDVDTAIEAMQNWLLARGWALVFIGVDGDPHEFMRDYNRHSYYILIGATDDRTGAHCAIYRNGELIHDPAWFPSPLVRDWQIVVITYVGH